MWLLVPLYLVRVFNKEIFGDYRALLLILVLFSRVFRLGIVEALSYAIRKEEGEESRNILSTNLFLHFVGLFLVIFLNFFDAQILDTFNISHLSNFFPLLTLCIFFYLVSSPFESLLIVTYKGQTLFNILIITEFLRSFLICSFVFLNNGISSALYGILCYSIIKYIIYLVYCFKEFDFSIRDISTNSLPTSLCFPLALSTIVGTFLRSLIKWFL